MPPKVKVGIDLLGSENPPELLLSATRSLAAKLPKSIELIAIGSEQMAPHDLSFIAAPETIEMSDSPLTAIRRKKRSSLCIGLKMLKEKKIDAFVSAGNTGALVMGAKMMIGMMPHLLRPALLALMPTKRKPLVVLDVGANVQCKADHLVQFALMGAAYQRGRGTSLPKVGLLNIDSEAMKGTSEIRLAYQELLHLSEQPDPLFSFAGNIEGKEVFNGNVDVLVTDGFTGNVFLKTAEGIASLVIDRLYERPARAQSHPFRGGLAELFPFSGAEEHPPLAEEESPPFQGGVLQNLPQDQFVKIKEKLSDLERHLHYAEYPGAFLAGIQGIVIKCHGYSSPEAFVNGIREAIRMTEEGFLQTLQNEINKYKFQKSAIQLFPKETLD